MYVCVCTPLPLCVYVPACVFVHSCLCMYQGPEHGWLALDRRRGRARRAPLLQQHPWEDAAHWRLHWHPADQSDSRAGRQPGKINTKDGILSKTLQKERLHSKDEGIANPTCKCTIVHNILGIKTKLMPVLVRWVQVQWWTTHTTRADTVGRTAGTKGGLYSFNMVIRQSISWT